MGKVPPDIDAKNAPAAAIDVADVAIRLEKLERTLTPRLVGELVPWIGTPPGGMTGEQEVKPGYLLCNGASISRATWPELYDEIGTKFGGSFDGSLFVIPNLVDRNPWGKAASGSRSTVGGFGGAASSTGDLPTIVIEGWLIYGGVKAL